MSRRGSCTDQVLAVDCACYEFIDDAGSAFLADEVRAFGGRLVAPAGSAEGGGAVRPLAFSMRARITRGTVGLKRTRARERARARARLWAAARPDL